MPKGDYYFKLYYQRLLTSTVGWKDEEFGAYMRLLIYQFDKGSIPSDKASLSRIAPSAKKHWKLLETKFIDDGNGGLINKVMNDVRNTRLNISEKKSLIGSAGGRPPANQKVSEIIPKGSQKESYTNGSSGIMVNGIENRGMGEGEKVVGSSIVMKLSEEAWKDQKWREELCIALNIKNELILRRWMAQFNVSVSEANIKDFDTPRYKRMIRGWIVKQQQKGVNMDTAAPQQDQSQNYRHKKIS
jgi:uncharacterized protein YdaU (DUF1376 family)